MIFYANVLEFGGGVWGFGRSDSARVIDVKGCWDGEFEGAKVVEEVPEIVRVF